MDYIIIGSGLSGLTSAAILSKLGKKVLVLEYHKKTGGCLHTFNKDGFEFETGYHYVGDVFEFYFLLSLICSKKIEFNKFLHYD